MPDYPIDLGRESGGGPSPAVLVSKEKYYPNLYLDNIADELDLPEDGLMVIRYHKTSETTTDREGEKTQCCSIEVREIVSVKPEKSSKNDEKSPGEILDEMLAEKQKDNEGEDY